jgi:hypothetical protein
MFTTIFVLESSWDKEKPLTHSSIMPMINEFAKQRGIKAYHQVFTDTRSFRHWIKEFNKVSNSKTLLYIASHGTEDCLYGTISGIKKTTIIHALKNAKKIQYVHFGACLFGNINNLKAILNNATHLNWAAGYRKSVDWVDSTLFDLLLWGKITPNGRSDEQKNIKTHTIVNELLNNQAKGLADELGFEFAYWYGSKIFPNSP